MRHSPLILVLLAFATSLRAQDARVVFAQPIQISGYASGIALEWEVYDDRSVEYYAILRDLGGVQQIVSTIPPDRASANAAIAYRYIDATPFAEGLRYRLRVVFEDGSHADGDWLGADRAHGTRTRILKALDSESLARLHIKLESASDQDVQVTIHALGGAELDRYKRHMRKGINTLDIDYARWPQGYYTVEVLDAEDKMEWLVHVDPSAPKATTRRIPGVR